MVRTVADALQHERVQFGFDHDDGSIWCDRPNMIQIMANSTCRLRVLADANLTWIDAALDEPLALLFHIVVTAAHLDLANVAVGDPRDYNASGQLH